MFRDQKYRDDSMIPHAYTAFYFVTIFIVIIPSARRLGEKASTS